MLPGGVAAELVEEPAGSNKYRPRVEQSYTYVEYLPATNSWKARDAAGIKYEFGTTADSKLATTVDGNPPREQMNGDHCDFTTAWALTKMEDANGNTIEITWEYKGDTGNYLLPDRIDYGGNASQSLPHFHDVEFDWLINNSGVGAWTATYRRGVEQRLEKRLWRIKPGTTKTTGGMPEYTFFGTGIGARYLLTTVQANDLPPQNFFYSEWDGEGHFAEPVIVNAPSSPEALPASGWSTATPAPDSNVSLAVQLSALSQPSMSTSRTRSEGEAQADGENAHLYPTRGQRRSRWSGRQRYQVSPRVVNGTLTEIRSNLEVNALLHQTLTEYDYRHGKVPRFCSFQDWGRRPMARLRRTMVD